MEILIISRYFWPEDGVSEEPYILKEYLDWHLSCQHKIDIVSGFQNHHLNDLCSYTKMEVKFSYFLSSIDRKLSFPRRIINGLLLLLLSLNSVIFKKSYDVIYLPSNPPFLALLVIICNKLFFKKSKIIFMIQDNMIYRIKNKLFKSLFKSYMKYTSAMSNIIIVLSEPMKHEIVSYFTKNKSKQIAKKINVLLNFSNLYKNSPKKIFAFNKRVIDIIYAGNHGESQNLINFLMIIKEMHPLDRPRVIFYGEGTDKENVVNYSKKHELGIKFYDAIPRNQILKKISESRYGLVCMSESLSRYAFPSKLATYLSCGTKVIVAVPGHDSLSNFVKDNEFGFIIDSSNPKSAAYNLKKYLKNKEELNSNFTQNFYSEFNKDNYFKKLNRILKL